MSSLWLDVKATLRSLVKNPVFTAFAIASLALGIGATTAIFSATTAVLFHPLAIEEPSRVTALYSTSESNSLLLPVSYAEYRDFSATVGAFADLSLDRSTWVTLSEEDGVERIRGALVAGNHFEVLGVRPAEGRFFTPEEGDHGSGAAVVVVSHDFWRQRLDGDPAAIGSTLRLNQRPFTVIGVAPSDFRGLNTLYPRELWFPLGSYPYVLSGTLRDWFDLRDGRIFRGIARLQPGRSLRATQQEVAGVADRLADTYPVENEGVGYRVVPITEATLNPNQRGNYVEVAVALLAVALVLLLIATVNVANLLVARAVERRQEMAVRLTLGVGRGRLVRQLFTEGLVLALFGCGAGLLVAHWGRQILWALRPPMIPETLAFGLDTRALGVALALSLLVAILFALAPLSQMLRVDLVSAMKGREGGAIPVAGKLRIRSFLVGAQVTLSLMALVCASVFILNVRRAQELDLGFAADELVVATFDLGGQGWEEPRGRQFYREVLERAPTLRGVRGVALSERVPLVPYGFLVGVEIEGREPTSGNEDLLVPVNTVSAGYFSALDIPILQGREFDASDREDGRRVAVINRTMAERFWPDEDPVGRLFRFSGEEEPLLVLGVAADTVSLSLGEDISPHVFLPLEQSYAAEMSLQVRADGDPEAVLGTLRTELRDIAPSLAFLRFEVFSDVLREALWPARLTAQLSSLFGLVALLLTAIGIYGVVTYVVQQRRQEVGIRMAMGGGRGAILRLFLVQGTRIILVGTVAGVLLALAAIRYFATLLVGIDTPPVASFALAAALLLIVALIAETLAAYRATRVEPRVALQVEA